MKKLIGLLLLLMISLSVSAQNQGIYKDVLNQAPRYTMFSSTDVNAYLAGDRTIYRSFEEHQYSFVKDNKFYIVSYDTTSVDFMREYGEGEMKTRELWLFSLDGENWERASDKALQTDYRYRNEWGIFSQTTYHPWCDKGGSVDASGENITIVLTTIITDNLLKENHYRVRDNIIILSPMGNGMYHVMARGHQND